MAVEGEDLAPTTLAPAWFQERVDRWRLGLLDLRDVEEMATVALTRAYDGPALRELAWRQDSRGEVDAMFPLAAAELGLDVPTPGEAFARLARAIARDVASGVTPLFQGAHGLEELCRDVYWDFGPEDFPPGFDQWELRYLMEWLEEDPAAGPQLVRRLEAVFDGLLTGRCDPPAGPMPDDMAPALGGDRSPEGPPPAPPLPMPRAPWTFAMEVVMERFFGWSRGDRPS